PPLKCKSDDVINMIACHFVVDNFTNLQALQLVMGNVIYRPAFEFLLENLGPNLKRLDISEYCDEGERMDWIVDAIRVNSVHLTSLKQLKLELNHRADPIRFIANDYRLNFDNLISLEELCIFAP